MINKLSACIISFLILSAGVYAQVGVGTTSPVSTLDVRGSLSMNYRGVTAGTTLTGTDLVVVFTGTSAATITLPTAVSITGRAYQIKNASTTVPTPVLTIATTSSQTIDGLTSWTLSDANASIWVISNGTNWVVSSQSLPSSSGSAWVQGGNSVSAVKTLGTTTNYDLSFITNNAEAVHISTAGNVGIGTSAFDNTNPETLLIDAGTNNTNTVLSASGTINDYFQLNLQNFSNGNSASTDYVATANNGTDNSTYIDFGINSQSYSNAHSNILNGGNTAYLYANAADFYIGNGATNKTLIFFTNTGTTGTTTANGTERMRITAAGNVGINSTSPSDRLTVGGNIAPDGNYDLGTSANRWNTVYATNGTINTSDARLKTNIHDLEYGLDQVMAMQPVRYNWKEKPNSDNKIGLLAQDVRKIIPEVVVGNEAKETLGINYSELVPVLINAIKELKQDLEATKKEVAELKQQAANSHQ